MSQVLASFARDSRKQNKLERCKANKNEDGGDDCKIKVEMMMVMANKSVERQINMQIRRQICFCIFVINKR